MFEGKYPENWVKLSQSPEQLRRKSVKRMEATLGKVVVLQRWWRRVKEKTKRRGFKVGVCSVQI